MEKLNRTTASLKAEFFLASALTFLLVAALSAASVFGCWKVRNWLLPDPNAVTLHIRAEMQDQREHLISLRLEPDAEERAITWLTSTGTAAEPLDLHNASFSLESMEASTDSLTPKRLLLYRTAGVAMALFPLGFSLLGIVLCAWLFYRTRLDPAISALEDAMNHIREQDLDFTISCPLRNELGRLCVSFESMRQVLYENNLRLWRTIEVRRTMQASVAHDLRNPLAILSGSVESLQESLRAGSLTEKKLERTLTNLSSTARRMERYTDYIRDLDAIEDVEIRPETVDLPAFLQEAGDAMGVLARAGGLRLAFSSSVSPCQAALDRQIFYRVLENMVSNAVRYARETIALEAELHRETLLIRITDDGPGFSSAVLSRKNSFRFSEDPSGRHPGLGLATSRILCEKHGGAVCLSNRASGGACAEITLAVRLLQTP